jgi:phosphatidylinositol alpha-mannosyltransferase
VKLAFYHCTLPEGRLGKEGGVSYVVHRLANALVGRGHELTLFSFDDAPGDALYQPKRLPVHRLSDSLSARLALAGFVLSGLDLHGFDVMHAHGDDHFVFRRPLPWVRTLYGSAKRELQSAVRLRRRLSQSTLIPLESLSARAADVTVGISRDTASCIAGIDEVIPCGVDLRLFHPSLGPRSTTPSILFVGTRQGRKRGDLVVALFERYVRPTLPSAELWMVCEPGESHASVSWYGKVSSERLVELYQHAWLFCLPSTYEGFGVPYVEALACGTPVVATPNPGAREILQSGRYGILADDGDLPDAILSLLSDTGRRQQMGERGLARASDFDWDHIAERYEDVYRRAQTTYGRRRAVVKVARGRAD